MLSTFFPAEIFTRTCSRVLNKKHVLPKNLIGINFSIYNTLP